MIRVSLKFLLLLLLITVGPFDFISQALAGQANVFIYHRFDEPRYPSTNISADLFESHLKYLQHSKTAVSSLLDVVAALRGGQPLPEKSAVLTVDDAFSSFLANGMPLIRRYKVPVTLFVNTDSVGTRGYLSWQELRLLVEEGVVIGNHTATHDYLVERKPGESELDWRTRVKADILRAQAAFKKELGLTPTLFAYPYGEFSSELVELVRDLGFDAAIAQQSGVVDEGSALYTLPRFPMGGGYASLKQFKSKLSMHRLDAQLLIPVDSVADVNPPTMQVRLDPKRFDIRRIQGFVQGDNTLSIEKIAGSEADFLVRAEKRLTGRRNKYTLTVPLRAGGWGWFSQPWILNK